MTSGDPLQCMDIAQAAGAAFNIRLQIIAGTVIALVTLVLLFYFGGVKFVGRPKTFAENMFLQCQKQSDITDQQARFDEVCRNG